MDGKTGWDTFADAFKSDGPLECDLFDSPCWCELAGTKYGRCKEARAAFDRIGFEPNGKVG